MPVRRQRELGRWEENSAALAAAVRALTAARDPAEARKAACEGARLIANAPVALVAEAVSDSAALVVLESVGADLRGVELWLGDRGSGAARALQEGQPVFTSPAAAPGDRDVLARAGADSAIWYPLGQAGVRGAVLAVAWAEEMAEVPARVRSLLHALAAAAELALARGDELDQMRRMVQTDQLTGLPNRRALEEQLPRELARARREAGTLSLAMLDLDHFKLFNDEHGHLAGDRLLERAAALWQQALRPYDILARFGGEEFMVILPGCTLGTATSIVERLRAVTPGGESCSAGVVEWAPAEHPDVLISRADRALYEAKRTGRNRTVAAPAAYS